LSLEIAVIASCFDRSVLAVMPALTAQAAEHGEAALDSIVQSPEPLQLASFPVQLAAIGLVLVISIVVDRFALRIGVPGALALFGAGVAIQPMSEATFDHKGFESLHVIALCLLLFYSGVKLCRRYFRRQDYLIPSLLLSVLGVLMVIVIGAGVMYIALGSIETRFNTSAQPMLIAMAMAYCIAPLDWGSFSFLVKRVHRFSDHVSGVLEFETAISAAMTLIIGDALFEFFTNQGATTLLSRAVNIFVGSISEGIVIGGVLGYLLSIAIKRFAVERSQSIDLAIGFVMIGYGFNSWIGQGGLVCSLVMGLVVSVMLSSEESKDEKEMLSVQLESINIACESLIFFMAGLSVDLSQGFLPSLVAGIVLVSVVWILRPVTVALFFRGSSFLNAGEQRFLSIWAPKGAISMALAITIPDLIEKSGIPYERVINPVSEAFVIDAVCFAVVISMLLKSLILPSLHKWLVVEVSEPSLEETASG
jgi:NhaP-type Na+/H+ or K+/H+ antiporter